MSVPGAVATGSSCLLKEQKTLIRSLSLSVLTLIEVPTGRSLDKSRFEAFLRFFPGNRFFRMSFHISEASIEQRLLLITQRIIIIEPTIAIQLGELQPDFITFLWREFGKFLEDFGLAHT